jgi:hypothetical protein
MDPHYFWNYDPDPHYIVKLDPDPHKKLSSEALEAQDRAVGGRGCS